MQNLITDLLTPLPVDKTRAFIFERFSVKLSETDRIAARLMDVCLQELGPEATYDQVLDVLNTALFWVLFSASAKNAEAVPTEDTGDGNSG